MAENNTNNTDNVSGTKGVLGGYIFVAPEGTALPTDYSTALSSEYKCLGYITKDGYKVTTSTDTEDFEDLNGQLMASELTEFAEGATLTLAEVKALTLKVMYGEDNVTDENGMITVKHNSNFTSVYTVVLDLLLKNNRHWRHCVPLFQCAELGDLTIAKSELASRQLTVKYLTDTLGNSCYDYIESTETEGDEA